jgi:hypothetical protein
MTPSEDTGDGYPDAPLALSTGVYSIPKGYLGNSMSESEFLGEMLAGKKAG